MANLSDCFMLAAGTGVTPMAALLRYCHTQTNKSKRYRLNMCLFLPLDEAVASRAVIVIVSGSDGNVFFLSQLDDSKTVRAKPYVSMGS